MHLKVCITPARAVPCMGWMRLWARCAPLGAAGRRGGSSCPARGSQAAAAVLLSKASLGSGVHHAPAPQRELSAGWRGALSLPEHTGEQGA